MSSSKSAPVNVAGTVCFLPSGAAKLELRPCAEKGAESKATVYDYQLASVSNPPRTTSEDIAKSAADGAISLHPSRIPLTRVVVLTAMNNIQKALRLPHGIGGTWTADCQCELERLLATPKRKRCGTLAIEDGEPGDHNGGGATHTPRAR